MKFIKILYFFIFFNFTYFVYSNESKNSDLNNSNCFNKFKKSIPCLIINKSISNSSILADQGQNYYTINSSVFENYGLDDINQLLEMIPGISVTQSGPRGQFSSVFSRGTGSNHTLVLLNGVPINDQSTTQGLHDFGVDFIKNIQQVEIYPGPNGVHFGSSAIGGAINFVTGIDYENKFKIIGNNFENYDFSSNYFKVTDNDWVFNLKTNLLDTKYASAIKDGTEEDKSKNYGISLKSEKWINNENRLFSDFYLRKTISDYDNSSVNESEYTGDNLMQAFQFGLNKIGKNFRDNYIFHFHQYDREYREAGINDEYFSQSIFARGEKRIELRDDVSVGIGTEYKYESGEFQNRGSYSASTKGSIDNASLFGNVGYEFFKDTIFSLFARQEHHKITGLHNTKKYNITHRFDNIKIGITSSEGLRNPSIYELYGTDNYGYSGNSSLKPEKSKSYEVSGELKLSDNLIFSMNIFKSKIYNHIEYKTNTYLNDSTNTNLNQSGVESSIVWKMDNQKISLFNSITSSKKTNSENQLRRPSKTIGATFEKKIESSPIGSFDIFAKYKYYGEHLDTHFSNFSTITMDATNLLDVSILKKIKKSSWSINITNILNEDYQRPHGYSQEKRSIKIGFAREY